MVAEHGEGAVERTVTYIKELFGMPWAGEAPGEPEQAANAVEPEAVFTSSEAMRKYPEEQMPESAAVLNARSARREDGE